MNKIDSWSALFQQEFEKEYFKKMEIFLHDRSKQVEIFPPENCRFRAFGATAPEDVKVVIIGQDPYHNLGQANGLAFSVDITPYPPSLKNIYKELVADLGVAYPATGDLSRWAAEGVLLINTTLSVEAHKPASHARIGWSKFTDAAIGYLNDNYQNVVYIVWGAHAYKKCKLIDGSRNCILASSHPSPLSYYKPFGEFPKFEGSRPFSKANAFLESVGRGGVNWSL